MTILSMQLNSKRSQPQFSTDSQARFRLVRSFSLRLPPRSILPLLSAMLLVGCGGDKGIQISGQPFDVMPVRLDVMDDEWEVIFTAPTGGWQARFDTHRPMFNGREVFITLTSPDPDAFVTQALTDLHVLTPVVSDTTIDVYARVVPFVIESGKNPKKKPNTPYHFAASSDERDPKE